MTAIDTLDRLLRDARSQNGWRDDPVEDSDLRAAFDIACWGPTSMNGQPMRLLFLRSDAAKQRLLPAVMPGNADKVLTAPVTAIIAYDTAFHEHLPAIFPHNPAARKLFDERPDLREETAFRNGTLQAAYFMLAVRARGLDVGPISGFDAAKVDAEFFAGTGLRSNFLCGIGRGDPARVFDRLPRLPYEVVASHL